MSRLKYTVGRYYIEGFCRVYDFSLISCVFLLINFNVVGLHLLSKQAQMPLREGRGPLPVVSTFKDTILDLKSIDLPARMILSCGRDGDIRLWR